MRHSLFYVTFLLLILLAQPTYANVTHIVPNAQKVGEIRLTYIIWDLYDATLYAPQGIWSNSKPFYLQLSYLRDIQSQDIVKQTIRKIRKQGFNDEKILSEWKKKLEIIFPNVHAGETLFGVYDGKGTTLFYDENKQIGRIDDPQFSQLFFNIWLGENSTFPNLTRKLLGQS